MARKRPTPSRTAKSVELPETLKRQVGRKPVQAKIEVKTSPVQAEAKPGMWTRLKAWMSPVRANPWDDLRSRVMDELKVRQGSGVENAPFVRPLLPEAPRKPKTDWVFRGFVLASLAVIVVLLLIGGRDHGPETALAKLHEAWEHKDGAALADVVDLPAVTADVVDQIYGSPVMNPDALPLEVRKDLKGDPAEINAMVKQGLAEMLEEDVAKAVVRGEVGAPEDSLLGHVWADVGGAHMLVSKPHLLKIDGKNAVAEVMLTRDDSHQVAEVVELKLRKDDGRWRVVGVPNLATVMARLNYVEAQIAKAESIMQTVEPAAGAVGQVLRVSRVEKPVSTRGAMKVRVEVANTSHATVPGNVVKLVFADAAGVPLQVVELEDPQPLAAGMRRTRVLNIPVNRGDKYARWVAELPLSALTVRAQVVAAN